MTKAREVWWSRDPADWLEAFHSHPRIGERKTDKPKGLAEKWSEEEQAGAGEATRTTSQALADLNRRYEEKFGFIFIVCATGRSSDEMLSILRERLGNNSEAELRMAAAEQARITELRLGKLLNHEHNLNPRS